MQIVDDITIFYVRGIELHPEEHQEVVVLLKSSNGKRYWIYVYSSILVDK